MDLKRAFDLLGIKKTSNQLHIKKAYHKKAKKLHPDKHHTNPQNAEADFKELACAYETALDHSHQKPERKNSPTRKHFKSQPPSSHQPVFSTDHSFVLNLTPRGTRASDHGPELTILDLLFDQILQLNHNRYKMMVMNQQDLHLFEDQDPPFSSPQESHFDTCGNHDPYTVCLKCHSSS